jgi:hypothetical protein
MSQRVSIRTCLLAGTLVLAACGGAGTVGSASGTAGSAPASPSSPGSAAPPSGLPTSTDPGPAESDLGISSPASPGAAVSGPVDVCSLLTLDEVTPLVPSAAATAAGPGVGPIAGYSCSWDDGSGTSPIPASLSVNVWPDFVSASEQVSVLPPDMLKQVAIDAATNDGGAVIDGLGDAGAVDPVSRFGPQVTFFAGDTMVQIDYSAQDGLSQQDAVVAIARLVAGRLP